VKGFAAPTNSTDLTYGIPQKRCHLPSKDRSTIIRCHEDSTIEEHAAVLDDLDSKDLERRKKQGARLMDAVKRMLEVGEKVKEVDRVCG